MSWFSFKKTVPISVEDYYEAKWIALESFYEYIDQGDDYELAIERFLYDMRPSNGFDDMVMILTLAARFYKFQHSFPRSMADEVVKAAAQHKKQFKKIRKSLGKGEAEDLALDYERAMAGLHTC